MKIAQKKGGKAWEHKAQAYLRFKKEFDQRFMLGWCHPLNSPRLQTALKCILRKLISFVLLFQLTKKMSSQKQETFEGIDFAEIHEVTSLENDEIKVLKICFNMFDVQNQGYLSSTDLDDILRGMGFRPSKDELKDILEEIDEDGSGQIEFAEFCQLCAKFLVEEPDEDTMKAELKEAFR